MEREQWNEGWIWRLIERKILLFNAYVIFKRKSCCYCCWLLERRDKFRESLLLWQISSHFHPHTELDFSLTLTPPSWGEKINLKRMDLSIQNEQQSIRMRICWGERLMNMLLKHVAIRPVLEDEKWGSFKKCVKWMKLFSKLTRSFFVVIREWSVGW